MHYLVKEDLICAQGEYQNLIPDYGNAIANRQDLQEQKPQKEGGFTYSSTVDIS